MFGPVARRRRLSKRPTSNRPCKGASWAVNNVDTLSLSRRSGNGARQRKTDGGWREKSEVNWEGRKGSPPLLIGGWTSPTLPIFISCSPALALQSSGFNPWSTLFSPLLSRTDQTFDGGCGAGILSWGGLLLDPGSTVEGLVDCHGYTRRSSRCRAHWASLYYVSISLCLHFSTIGIKIESSSVLDATLFLLRRLGRATHAGSRFLALDAPVPGVYTRFSGLLLPKTVKNLPNSCIRLVL